MSGLLEVGGGARELGVADALGELLERQPPLDGGVAQRYHRLLAIVVGGQHVHQ
jgi:hypothetical protein